MSNRLKLLPSFLMGLLSAANPTNLGPGALRLILAKTVVMHHVTRYFPFGTTAVYIFFILSGYWVTRIWQERHAGSPNHTFYAQSYYRFIASRSLRIFPLYWLCLIADLCIFYLLGQNTPLFEHSRPQAYDLTVLATLLALPVLPYKVVNPAWSLAVELQYYLIAPAVFLILNGRKLSTQVFLLISLFVLS